MSVCFWDTNDHCQGTRYWSKLKFVERDSILWYFLEVNYRIKNIRSILNIRIKIWNKLLFPNMSRLQIMSRLFIIKHMFWSFMASIPFSISPLLFTLFTDGWYLYCRGGGDSDLNRQQMTRQTDRPTPAHSIYLICIVQIKLYVVWWFWK